MRAVFVVVAAMLAAILPAGVAHAQDRIAISAADQRALAGPWFGDWRADGYVYDGQIALTVSADGEVEGTVTWTLRESPIAGETRIGLSGVEHVLGDFDPETGSLRLEGHRKDDPDNVIGLDTYRLVVGRNHAVMVGLTGNHGRWDGIVTMRR